MSRKIYRLEKEHAAGPRPSRNIDRGLMSFDEIGARLGISRQRAQQSCNRAMWKLMRAFEQMGVDGGDIRGRTGSMLSTAELWSWGDAE